MRSRYLILLLVTNFLSGCHKSGDKHSRSQGIDSDKKNRYKIAYNVLKDAEADDYEVFIMNQDGSGQKNISNHKGVDWVYYAYLDKVYFISDRDTTHRVFFLYEMDTNGENVRKVTDMRLDDSQISGRNNGRELIVKPHATVDTAFYLIDLENQQQQIIKPALAYFHDPCFSPDGKQIVFRGARERSSRSQAFDDELYIMNTDGSAMRQLTYYPKDDNTAEWFDYRAAPPVWYLKNKISYASKQDGSYSIFSINTDGSSLVQLTSGKYSQVYHDWTPDGTKMVFEQASNEFELYNIYILDAKTGKIKQLTDDTVSRQAPVFVLTD